MTGFAEMIAAADPAGAAVLQELLALARTEVPEVEEGISYGVPALRHRGRPLIGVGQTANGYSVYPFSAAVVAAVSPDLPGYRVSKGTIGFSVDRPIPTAVLSRIIQLRLAELDQP